MTVQTIDRKNLIEVLLKNPDLPMMADVDSEIVTEDGCGWWLGEVKDAYIKEVWVGKQMVYEKEDALMDSVDFMEAEFPEKLPDVAMVDDAEVLENFVKNLPWKKAIIVQVSTPDSLQEKRG